MRKLTYDMAEGLENLIYTNGILAQSCFLLNYNNLRLSYIERMGLLFICYRT